MRTENQSSSADSACRAFPRPRIAWQASCLTLLFCLCSAILPLAAQTPLPRAHAHNDYLHTRPLLDALASSFCSVEADIHLVDGQLLVAHDLENAWPTNTLEKLYLEPLSQRVKQNGGQVYIAPAPFTLLIDIKSEPEPTYAALRLVLKRYQEMLTSFSDEKILTNAVTIILSGNRPILSVSGEAKRLVSIDGRLPDLDTKPSPGLVPLISDNWTKHFDWRGTGPLPEKDTAKLARIVKATHAQGRKLRFWAVPDNETAWGELHKAGVDFLNTDRLSDLEKFLRSF